MKKTSEANGTYESYTYDELGRVKTTTKYIDASNVYTYTNVYDQSGKITQVTYPAGNIVNNQYDKYGNLIKVLFTSADGTNTNTPVCTLNTSNATTLTYGLGNGLTTTKSYDASKGYSLSSIVTAYQSNQVQSCYYDFNAANGNLNSREDRRTGYNLKESFVYDGLYRLTSWSVAKNGINTFSNSLAYNPDKSGNIDSKSDIGTYGYGITGKPHQLKSLQLTQTPFYQSVPHSISYTSFGKVNRLDDHDYTVLFTYGPDQQRCKSVMQGRGATQYTIYYGGAYEKKVMASGTTTQYTYIPAGDGLAAVFMKTGSAAGTLYYIHKDHLGSVTALTNTAGNIVEQYAYDPWGRRLNPQDWTFTNVPTPTLLSRGFTGHEHIDEITLINMNGRIYDPVLGMFISPDNYLQSPTQSQNFNRYSYCLGNPLKYTDPEGEWFIWDDLTEFIVGGVVNVIFNWGQIDNFWEGLSYFGSGGAGAWITFQTFGLAAPVGSAITSAGNSMLETNFLTKENGYSFKSISGSDWGDIVKKTAIGAGTAWAGDWLGGKLSDKVQDKLNIKSEFWSKSTDKMIKNGITDGLDTYLNSTIIAGNAWDSKEAFQDLGMGIGLGVAKGMTSTLLEEKWARPELQKIKEFGFVLNIKRESGTNFILKYLYNPLLPPSYRFPSPANFYIPNSNN